MENENPLYISEDDEAVEDTDNQIIDEDSDEIIIDESVDLEADEDTEDELDDGAIDVFGRSLTKEDPLTMESQQLKDADYRKKTMALASERKGVADLNSDLTALASELEALFLSEVSSAEMEELKEDDYVEYLRRKESIDAKRETLTKAKAKSQEALSSTIASENQKLIDAMTEWNDPKKGQITQKSDLDGAYKYAVDLGFSNDDIGKLSDHRITRALIDAGKYRKLKESNVSQLKRKTKAGKKTASESAKGPKQTTIAERFYGANN